MSELRWIRTLVLVIAGWSALCGAIAFAADEPKADTAPKTEVPSEKPEEAPLPKLNDLPTPSAEDLLQKRPVDWIVLLNQDVLIVEPVQPRPGTVDTLKQQHDELLKVPTTKIPLDEKLQRLAELERLKITLVDDSADPEYSLEIRFIDQILYFEDLVLKRVALLTEAGELPSAYELLMLVARRNREWPGYVEAYRRLLFAEAQSLHKQGQTERALVLAEQLADLQSDYPEISRLLGTLVDALMTAAVEQRDYRRARHFLFRLKRRHPEHRVATRWTDELQRQSSEIIQSARAAAQAGDYRTASSQVDVAARIWPETPGLTAAHRDLIRRCQILRVGVVSSATGIASPFETPSRERRRRLCELKLFEEDRVQDGVVRYRSRIIEAWEPNDLGREVDFRLKMRRADWESRPIVTSGDIVNVLAERALAGQPNYEPCWRRDMQELAALAPDEWSLTLSRIPLRVESRLRVSVPLTADVLAWNPDIVPDAASRPSQQRFYLSREEPGFTEFRRTRPQPTASHEWFVSDVVEHHYPDWEASLQGLLRGEVDLLPVAEPRDVEALGKDSRLFVVPYALPRTHLIQINPASELAQNTLLRRALLTALDRPQLLREQVLNGAPATMARLVTGPFATKTIAYDPQLLQPEADPLQAASLGATAKRQAEQELPTWKLMIPDDAIAARVTPQMIASWKRVGLRVELQADPAGPWDLAYRSVRLTEPVEDIWTLLHPDGTTDWQKLDHYPQWLRDRLWSLEQAVDWASAQRLIQQIQSEFLIEARWLPLWEIDEYLVARRRVSGIPARPIHAYQDIERWSLQSWYPTEVP